MCKGQEKQKIHTPPKMFEIQHRPSTVKLWIKEQSKMQRPEAEKQLEDGNGRGHYVRPKAMSILVWSLKAISLILFPELTQMELGFLPDLRSKEGRGGGEGTEREEKRPKRRRYYGLQIVFLGTSPLIPHAVPKVAMSLLCSRTAETRSHRTQLRLGRAMAPTQTLLLRVCIALSFPAGTWKPRGDILYWYKNRCELLKDKRVTSSHHQGTSWKATEKSER